MQVVKIKRFHLKPKFDGNEYGWWICIFNVMITGFWKGKG